MNKIYDVILNCFESAAFFVQFPLCGFSLVVYCTDETMKTETRLQLIKNYYVTVVFLAQQK